MKWFRNKEMLQDILNQNKNELEKYKHEKIVSLLKDETNLIQDHLTLLDENEKLKKALDVFVKHLQIEWGLQESWLQFRNGDAQSDDLEPEEHKLLKEVSENKL